MGQAMQRKHQKRRNSLLLYEFLTRNISSALIEGDGNKSARTLRILKKAFKPGSQLYNEFRIMNALAKTTVSSESVAYSIITEAKRAVKKHDVVKLDKEKSYLIKNINHTLNDKEFFDQHVNEYKMFATMQVLMNEWRNGSPDLEVLATHEDVVVKWLMSEKVDDKEQALSEQSPGTNRLLMKIMMTKLNEKYSGSLSKDQKELIREYVWATSNDNQGRIKNKLVETKLELIRSLDQYIVENSGDVHLLKQLNDVKSKLVNEDFSVINDDVITQCMQYMKLSDEFASKE